MLTDIILLLMVAIFFMGSVGLVTAFGKLTGEKS
jgi:hypothetical protein